MRWRLIGFLSLAVSLLLAQAAFANPQKNAAAEPGTAERRLAHLHHGINVDEWFWGQSDPAAYTQEHFEKAVTPEDLALIRSMGFDHVRLAVDPRPMIHNRQPEQISPADLVNLDAAVKMILDQDLAVEIAIFGDSDFKQKLGDDDAYVEGFADFWRALAKHFSTFDPDRVFFEILNEPEGRDRYRWYGIEAKLASAIREGAPQNTIIATGAHWSNDDDLVFLEPLRDANVIYTFHFYESHIFTHQGATWSTNYWHYLRGVPYPSDPERARKAAEMVPDPVDRLAVIRYGLENWNAARIDAEVGQADDWAKHWNVPLICNEFGVYRVYADPGDRAAWITDVRTALEKRGIGWAMWDYSGDFGVVSRQSGRPVPDPMTVLALGRTLAGGSAGAAH